MEKTERLVSHQALKVTATLRMNVLQVLQPRVCVPLLRLLNLAKCIDSIHVKI
jgi:hypothetical protein